MDFTAVLHKTSEQMSYARNEEELIVNLRTGYDIRRVFICHGDPFDAGILGGNEVWTGERTEIIHKKRLKHQQWWTTTLKPPFKRCKYYFELETEAEVWFYFEDGFLTKDQLSMEGKMLQCFTVPWMNQKDLNITPDWVNETVWYQIFPDRFCNGSPKDGRKGVTPWRAGMVKNEECFGGNLEGILEKLPYLADLGINGIYLNPIFTAGSNHKYDTTDYRSIDPAFGDELMFGRLVKAAHSRGIRVMIDGVFNHCGPLFKPWRDVVERGPESPCYDWFMIHQWPFGDGNRNTRDGAYYSFAFCGGMPKLNTGNEEVIRYFSDVCSYWVETYGVDGIRFDVGNEVSHKFLKRIHERLKTIRPDLYLLGEIWHDASQWLLGDEYDSVMNYPLTSSINNFFLDQGLGKEDFEYMINRCYTMYMQQNNNVLFNLLDSHDTDRLMSRVKDIDLFFQQLTILFTMPGSPCIYYGTEIAMEGGHDPDCRRCMPWAEIDGMESRITEVKKLIYLRKSEPAFRSLYFHFPNEREGRRLIEYRKLDEDGNQLEVLINCCGLDIKIYPKDFPGGENFMEVLYERHYRDGVLGKNGILICRR